MSCAVILVQMLGNVHCHYGECNQQCALLSLYGTLNCASNFNQPLGERAVTKDEYCQYVLDSFRPAESLLKMVPADKLDWKPGPTFMSLGQLICHMSGGVGGELRMLVTGNWPKPEEMEGAMQQGSMPSCNVQEALANLESDKSVLREVLAGVTEEDFRNRIVSVPWGWESKMERMALDFREHFINHKMQLFTYLKLLGFPVNTNTLYFG
jgi:hypothetical protein